MTAQKPEDGGAYVQFINKDKEREKKEEEEKEKREEEEKVKTHSLIFTPIVTSCGN